MISVRNGSSDTDTQGISTLINMEALHVGGSARNF